MAIERDGMIPVSQQGSHISETVARDVKARAASEWANSPEFARRTTENVAKEIIETKKAKGEPVSHKAAYEQAKEEIAASKAAAREGAVR